MIKKISYIFLIILLVQVIGFYTVAKTLLVEKLLSERSRITGLEEIDFINVNSNYSFKRDHKKTIKNIFDHKQISYYDYQDIYKVPANRIFAEDTLAYTFEIKDYIIPISIVQQSETVIGFGASDEIMYAWVLFKWIEVKYISGGIS